MIQSISNWEESHFGGFRKILSDYPEIKTPFKINVKIPEDCDLGYFSAHKLMNIFQLKIHEHGLIDSFLEDARKEKEKKFWGGEKTLLVVEETSVSSVLDKVIVVDEELRNLFEHYKDLIAKTKFSYEIEDKEEKEEEEGGSGAKEASMDECLKQAKTLSEKVMSRKRYIETSHASVTGNLKAITKFRLMPKSAKPTRYSHLEVLYSEQLLALLDISFDPKEDKIDNLRMGKISTDKIASVPAGNFHIYHKVEENQTTKPFSVCVLADESGSMSYAGGTEHQRLVMKVLYRTFSQIMSPGKIFIYGHSDRVAVSGEKSCPEVRVYNDNYNQIFDETIDMQRENRFGENYDGPVIECIYEKIRSVTSDNIIFITLSDGAPSGEEYGGEPAIKGMKQVIEKCKRDGFVTMGIGIGHVGVKDIYNYNTIVTDMSQMVKQVSMLVNQVVKSEFQ